MPVACTRRGRRLASALNVASEHQSPRITARFAATTTTRKRDSGRSKGLRLACVVIAVEQRKPTDRDVGNRILIKRVQMKFVREVVFGHAANLTVSDDPALNFAGQHLLKQWPVHRAVHQRLPRPAQLARNGGYRDPLPLLPHLHQSGQSVPLVRLVSLRASPAPFPAPKPPQSVPELLPPVPEQLPGVSEHLPFGSVESAHRKGMIPYRGLFGSP